MQLSIFTTGYVGNHAGRLLAKHRSCPRSGRRPVESMTDPGVTIRFDADAETSKNQNLEITRRNPKSSTHLGETPLMLCDKYGACPTGTTLLKSWSTHTGPLGALRQLAGVGFYNRQACIRAIIGRITDLFHHLRHPLAPEGLLE